jgi:hypothetical protein
MSTVLLAKGRLTKRVPGPGPSLSLFFLLGLPLATRGVPSMLFGHWLGVILVAGVLLWAGYPALVIPVVIAAQITLAFRGNAEVIRQLERRGWIQFEKVG